MVKELSERKNKLSIQLNDRDKQPQIQAEKKGQISEGLRIAENEKIEKVIEKTKQIIVQNNIENKTSKIEWDGKVGMCLALCSFSRLAVVQCIIATLLETAHQLLDPYP